MTNPSAKTLQTLDLAIIRFEHNLFTKHEFNNFIKEAQNAGLDVCTLATLRRYKFIKGEDVDIIINTYSPIEMATFVTDLMYDDMSGCGNDCPDIKFVWDEEHQNFKEIHTIREYHLDY